MPHQCTNCQETFPDGSKEMLSGCPDCGHNTFQYIPEGADPEPVAEETPPEPPIDEDSVTGKVTRAASTVKDYVRAREEETRKTGSGDVTDTPSSPTQDTSETTATAETSDGEQIEETGPKSPEDSAQASARGEVADISELTSESPSETTPSSEQAPTADSADRSEREPPQETGRVVEEPNVAANSDLEELREELNDQFESIRIVEPGQYELNLMELYDREEHIVALREDGKYVIEVPETWRDVDETDR